MTNDKTPLRRTKARGKNARAPSAIQKNAPPIKKNKKKGLSKAEIKKLPIRERISLQKKNKRRNRAITVILIFVFLISALLIYNKPILNFFAAWNANHNMVIKHKPSELEANKKKKGNFDFSQVKPISADELIANMMNTQNLPMIGGIAYPDVGINLPIFKGIAYENLFVGAGTMKPNEEMGEGNYAIASHHIFGWTSSTDDSQEYLFSPLQQAQVGQTIYLTDLENTYEYISTRVEDVPTNDTEVINDVPGQKLLTLVTCADYDATVKRIVQGKLVKVIPWTTTSNTIKSYFAKTYNQYNLY